ncbi:ATP-dependent helicase [Candidatus Pacearchaeota archaeon]|nr:ATP-dependent helicase [Candidatus Pacearchaeota archaeon]
MVESKIEFIGARSSADVKGIMHPIVKEWFFAKFKDFSLTQLYGVANIHERKNILISAPTGGTKTLTAFLSILNYLVSLAAENELEDKIYAVYVSPLRALTNDIYVNLERPLTEIKELAESKGIKLQDIRVGLRTGDTTPSERAKMTRKVPHIFVTTPESLAIVLTAPKFSENLRALEFIVVDEVHALANKRGVFLSLMLERLEHFSAIPPVRIGLSATIAPIEEIAKFLVGAGRECLVAQVPLVKDIDIGLISPGVDLLTMDGAEDQKRLYHILDELIGQHKTTLIFTNTRNATERIIHYLDMHFPGKYTGNIGAHHSSMSRSQRFMIEERLRKGELKVVVSSTSLELGIDIGSIDLVVLLRSPKSVSRALQRIGRAGHQLHSNPKGRFVVTDRDDLVECAVLMKHMKEKIIDRVDIPMNALDVLAQHIYGMAISQIWNIDDVLKLIRKSYCYSNLSKEDFMSIISYLSGDYDLEHRNVYAKIWYDKETKQLGKKGKLARLIYLTNIGTIPEEGFVSVVVGSGDAKGNIVGSIDESFLERLKKGDVFVLGGVKYQFIHSKGMKAYVIANVSKSPTIPSWFSEQLPLSFDVASAIAKFRGFVKERVKNSLECVKFIQDYCYCTSETAGQIYRYCLEQEDFSVMPTDKKVIVELFKQDKDYMLFHSMYGRRVNDALSRAYAFIAAQLKHRDIEVGVNDNGFFIAGDALDTSKILKGLTSSNLRKIVEEAVEKTDVLKRRFRHCAARSLMILRNYKGRSKSVGKQQVHSHFLYSAVNEISRDFPIMREARREVLNDLMDISNAESILKKIERKEINFEVVRTPLVSPFGLNLITQSHSDFIKVEDRVNFLKRMHELQMKVIEKR